MFDAFLNIFIVSAGVGFIITVILALISDFLYRRHFSSIQPERILGHDVLGTHDPVEATKGGLYALFLLGWLTTLAFVILWGLPWYQSFNGGSLAVGAFFFSFCVYLTTTLVFFPLLNKGFFGARHHNHLPYWTMLVCVLYAILLMVFVPLAFGI